MLPCIDKSLRAEHKLSTAEKSGASFHDVISAPDKAPFWPAQLLQAIMAPVTSLWWTPNAMQFPSPPPSTLPLGPRSSRAAQVRIVLSILGQGVIVSIQSLADCSC